MLKYLVASTCSGTMFSFRSIALLQGTVTFLTFHLLLEKLSTASQVREEACSKHAFLLFLYSVSVCSGKAL